MTKLVVANWKMNPKTPDDATRLARLSDVSELVLCPPFPFLPLLSETLERAALGAQDVFWQSEGAYTGEVSAEQLKALGVKYVIVGHSERRRELRETDEMTAKKLRAALDVGLEPILCVGETKQARATGQKEAVLKHQLEIGLSQMKNCRDRIFIVYEPIWAIGTGVPDKPADTVRTIQFMEKVVEAFCRGAHHLFLYGGSVTAKNAEAFLRENMIGGLLVGGASLRPEEIVKIADIATRYSV